MAAHPSCKEVSPKEGMVTDVQLEPLKSGTRHYSNRSELAGAGSGSKKSEAIASDVTVVEMPKTISFRFPANPGGT